MAWREILTWSIVLPFIPLNWVYWWAVQSRWQARFRRYCEQRFGVTIGPAPRGYWRVSGGGSAFRNFALEWLQLLYFIAAFIGWSLAMLALVGVLMLINE